MRIAVIDNYDSFTYNLVHLVKKLAQAPVDVFLNDQAEPGEVADYDKIILSPGPGIPSEAGRLMELIRRFAPEKSMLGVCLGHQAIAEACGASLINLDTVFHGVSTACSVEIPGPIFSHVPQQFRIGRYHSWIIDEATLPEELQVTARDDNGYIMAMQHRHWNVHSVQFHPESVLTEYGPQIMKNWLLDT